MCILISAPDDFDFQEAVSAHGWPRLLPFSWDDETKTLSRIEQFAEGRIAMLTMRGSDGGIEVETSGDASSDELNHRIQRMFQLDLDITAFHAYCATHLELQHIPALKQGRLLRSPTLFEDVLKVIATTNTTWLQTKGMVARLVEHFGSPLPSDPSLRAFPTPQQIAATPLEEFALKAKMGYRNSSAHRIAVEIAEGRLDLESWQDPAIPSPDLLKRLLALPGIGPYAASCLMIYLGRYDRVNVDSWARMMVGKELARAVTDKDVHAFFEPYGEWKALVYHFYKWREEEPGY